MTTPAPAPAPAWLVFHADDLGLAHGFNEAIRDGHRRGHIASTSVQAAGAAYAHALREVIPDCPALGLGAHVNLVECRSLLPPRLIPDLVDADGVFRGYRPLLAAIRCRRRRRQAIDEARAQIERLLSDGIALDHLNTHRHVHMLPGLFESFCGLAAEYGIPFIRLVRERFHWPRPLVAGGCYFHELNAVKMLLMNRLARRNAPHVARFGLRANDAFVGLSYSGRGCAGAVAAALRANAVFLERRRRAGGAPVGGTIVELLLHVAYARDPRDACVVSAGVQRYCDDPARRVECDAARSPDLLSFIERLGLWPTDYRRLSHRSATVGGAGRSRNSDCDDPRGVTFRREPVAARRSSR